MKKRALGIVALTAFVVVAAGGPVAADAEHNGRNCIGVAASNTDPKLNGPNVADWATTQGPGAMAERVDEVRRGLAQNLEGCTNWVAP